MNMLRILFFLCCVLLIAGSVVASDLINTVTNDGVYGNDAYATPSMEYPAGSNKDYLWEGRFWAGAKVNGQYLVSHADYLDYEWTPAGGGLPTSEVIGDDVLEYTGVFDDLTGTGTHTPIGFEVTQTATAYTGLNVPMNSHLLELSIENVSGAQLDSVYFAWVFDFDVAAGTGGDQTDPNIDDLCGWDETRWVAYMYDGDNPDEPGDDTGDNGLSPGYAGVAWIDGDVTPCSFQWWDWYNDPADDDAKYHYMAGMPPGGGGAFAQPPATPYDYRVLLGVGPYTMAAGEVVEIAMTLAVGEGMNGLLNAVDSMIDHYDVPVEFELTPQVTTIPPGGGAIVYDVSIISTLNITVPGLRYWTKVVLPNGQLFGPLSNIPWTHTPFMNVTITGLTQQVPAMAPSGIYQFLGLVGFYPNELLGDEFFWEKTGTVGNGSALDPDLWPAEADWSISGEGDQVAVNVPSEFTLSEAWPNPFNSSATVSVTLPESSDLTVSVYNTSGQKVATLTDGNHNAGAHTFSLNADRLASGIYFITASTPDYQAQTRKVMLVR